MADFPTSYGRQEAIRRHLEERQRANAYITLVEYALVFLFLVGALGYAVEVFSQRRREEERRRARHLGMFQLPQMMR